MLNRVVFCRILTTLLVAVLLLPAATAAAAGPGDFVPFFKAVDLEGRSVSLGELIARHRVAVFFWDWRRATSTRAMQVLDRMHNVYAQQGFAVVAVEGEGTPAARVAERVEKLRAIGAEQRYVIVPDPGGRIARQFRVESTPQIFLLDGAGRIFLHLEDFRSDDEAIFEERLRECLGMESPPTRRVPVAAPAPASVPVSRPAERKEAPEDPTVALLEKYRYFGNYHLNRGELDKAEEYYRKSIALAPDAVDVLLQIGEVCARQRRYDQAREAWEQVLRLEPGNREADVNIRRLIRGEY